MKHLAALFAACFALSGLPALASAASSDVVRTSASGASCRAKKKAKKETAENKGKKKDDKKSYGFEL
jgi:hypothetical protein